MAYADSWEPHLSIICVVPRASLNSPGLHSHTHILYSNHRNSHPHTLIVRLESTTQIYTHIFEDFPKSKSDSYYQILTHQINLFKMNIYSNSPSPNSLFHKTSPASPQSARSVHDMERPRTRSRAIAIKQDHNLESDSEDLFERANYDMATWRMYNRIVAHRQSRRRQEGSSSSSDLQLHDSLLPGVLSAEARQLPQPMSQDDDEIFQLDL